MVPRLDGLVEAECRQMLSVAATRIFSNFWLLHHVEALRFPFGKLLEPIELEVEPDLGEKVAEHVEALSRHVHKPQRESGSGEGWCRRRRLMNE